MKGVRSWEERAPRTAHRVYVVVGLLCLVAFGLIGGAYLEENPPPLGASNPAPADLAPPAPSVPEPIACDELKARQQEELANLGDARLVQAKQANALAVIAYTLAHATCRP